MQEHDVFPCMADKIPEGSVGSARVTHFTVTRADSSFAALRSVVTGRRAEIVSPGRYARLSIEDELVMTDTNMERRTNRPLIEHARGHVLVGGLGLGMVVFGLLAKKPAIRSLVVLEVSPDVIALIQPHLPVDARLTIVQVDVFGWDGWLLRKGPQFDTIYFDIWPSIQASNIPSAELLRGLAAGRVARGGWMGDWDTAYRKLERR
jgi:spermidine synthase